MAFPPGYNLTELELSGALPYIQQGEVPFGPLASGDSWCPSEVGWPQPDDPVMSWGKMSETSWNHETWVVFGVQLLIYHRVSTINIHKSYFT